MPNKKRVVITGMGQLSPVGNNVQDAWNNLIKGECGIELLKDPRCAHLKHRIGGTIKNLDISQYISNKDLKKHSQFSQYALIASMEAIADAGLDDIPNLNKGRVGVIIGSGIGGTGELIDAGAKYKITNKVSPFALPSSIINIAPANVAILKGYHGPNYALVSACTTGSHSIGLSFRTIQYGDADIMVTGGAEAPVIEFGVASFSPMRALSSRIDDPKTASRPWDKDRDGFVLGEGAGILVLEEYEHAKKRGATIHAEIIGFAANEDAYHITAPIMDGSIAAEGITLALKDANINHYQVNYINAHGTSTFHGDIAETNAIKKAFKDYAYKVAISSTKSATGHLLGAAGGVEAIYSILAIKNNIAPPTINIFEQDIENGCDLDYCKNKARELPIDIAISNSFGFGGQNATLVFKKFK